MKNGKREVIKVPAMSVVVPLKVPTTMKERVAKVAASSASLSEADVMREAIERGLPELEKFFTKPAAA